MGNFDLRLPNITGQDADTQLKQMSSYLYQMVEQLNWALNTSNANETAAIQYSENGEVVVPDDSKSLATFESIKDLIIKSADIVEAYSEQMSHTLKGAYVATSEFGKYFSTAELDFEGTPTNLTQFYKLVEGIDSDVTLMRNTNAYIKEGMLDVHGDGVPVFGIEVGQITKDEEGKELYNAFARFTANGLYLYNADSKVPSAEFSTDSLVAKNMLVYDNQGNILIQADSKTGYVYIRGSVIDTDDLTAKNVLVYDKNGRVLIQADSDTGYVYINGSVIDAEDLVAENGDFTEAFRVMTPYKYGGAEGMYAYIEANSDSPTVKVGSYYAPSNEFYGAYFGLVELDGVSAAVGGGYIPNLRVDRVTIGMHGAIPITDETIGSQNVNHASTAGTANNIKMHNGGTATGIGTGGGTHVNSINTASGTAPYAISVNGSWGGSGDTAHNITSGASDIRLKDNVKDTKIDSAIDVINQIKVREFDWKQNREHQKIGFIADELDEIDERFTVGGGYEEDGTPNYKSIDTLYLVGYLTKAVQELSAEVESLKAQINRKEE